MTITVYKATVLHEGKRVSLVHRQLPPELVVDYSYPGQWIEAPIGGLFVCKTAGEAFGEGGYGVEVWEAEAERVWEKEATIPDDFGGIETYRAFWEQGIMPKRWESSLILTRIHLFAARIKLTNFVGVQPWNTCYQPGPWNPPLGFPRQYNEL
jgi:hypothetical protein